VDPRADRRRRESPATYRRRRLTVAVVAVVLLAATVELSTRLRGDVDQVVVEVAGRTTAEPSTGGGTTDEAATDDTTDPATPPTTGGPMTGDPATSSTLPAAGAPATTTAGVAGFSSPYEFLACVRARESRGDYAAVSPGGGFFGAYQIDQVTWDSTAEHSGLSHLRGLQPNLAAPASQDLIAMALLQWQGTGPWAGGCIPPAPGT
jgi:hypothetical protein